MVAETREMPTRCSAGRKCYSVITVEFQSDFRFMNLIGRKVTHPSAVLLLKWRSLALITR